MNRYPKLLIIWVMGTFIGINLHGWLMITSELLHLALVHALWICKPGLRPIWSIWYSHTSSVDMLACHQAQMELQSKGQVHHEEALCVGMKYALFPDVSSVAPSELINKAERVRCFLKLMMNLTSILQKAIEITWNEQEGFIFHWEKNFQESC